MLGLELSSFGRITLSRCKDALKSRVEPLGHQKTG